jgi:hypothetical protein
MGIHPSSSIRRRTAERDLLSVHVHQSMRRISIAVFFALTLFLFSPGGAQTPDASQEERLQTLIKEVQTRQAQIADNQTKIDSKLADIAETIRQARLFAGRSN